MEAIRFCADADILLGGLGLFGGRGEYTAKIKVRSYLSVSLVLTLSPLHSHEFSDFWFVIESCDCVCSCLSWVQMEETMKLMETYWQRQMFWPMTVLLGMPIFKTISLHYFKNAG